jgi:hypothetical protein
VLEIDEGLGRPQSLAESLTSDEFARLLEQPLQNFDRLVGNPEACGTTFMQLTGAHIELERPETDGTAGRNPIGIANLSKVVQIYHASVQYEGLSKTEKSP